MTRIRSQPRKEPQLKDISLHSQKGDRFRDLLLYCAIAVSIVLILMLVASHQAKTHQTVAPITKWINFAFITAFIFGYAARDSRDIRKQGKFWWLLAFFAAVHIGLGIAVLRRVYQAPLMDFVLIGVPEYYVLIRFLDRFMRGTTQ